MSTGYTTAMADLEHFSLRWNNFHSNLSSGFQALLQEEDLVDVTLAAGGEFVQAHKIILSVCSPYFKQLFKVNPCKHPIVILKDVYHKDLVDILQFMYQGEVNVRQEDLGAFLKTAELLQIKGLTGHDSPAEPPTERDAPAQTPSERSTPRPRPPRRRIDKPATPRVEKQASSRAQSPMPSVKRMKVEAPASRSPIVVNDDPSTVEYIDLKCPKQEPVDDYEPETESLPSEESRVKDDPAVEMLLGESSHSLHDTMQGMSSETDAQDAAALGLIQQSVLTSDSTPAGAVPGISGASADVTTSQDNEPGLAHYMLSNRGHKQLVHEGYMYYCHSRDGPRTYWRCLEYSRNRCRGYCTTFLERDARMTRPHNHGRRTF